jgi:hypothetical protein
MNISQQNLQSVLEILMEKFPNKLPKDKIAIEELHIKIGQQQVITYLEEIYERLAK